VTDVDESSVTRVVEEFGAKFVRPTEIFSTRANILAPCALGGVINDATIPELNVQIVAGAANNQLLEDRHGAMLRERNILYAPDYVANAGGVLRGCTEILSWAPDYAATKIEEIYDTMLRIFEGAEAQGLPTNEAADRLAEDRLRNAAAAH